MEHYVFPAPNLVFEWPIIERRKGPVILFTVFDEEGCL